MKFERFACLNTPPDDGPQLFADEHGILRKDAKLAPLTRTWDVDFHKVIVVEPGKPTHEDLPLSFYNNMPADATATISTAFGRYPRRWFLSGQGGEQSGPSEVPGSDREPWSTAKVCTWAEGIRGGCPMLALCIGELKSYMDLYNYFDEIDLRRYGALNLERVLAQLRKANRLCANGPLTRATFSTWFPLMCVICGRSTGFAPRSWTYFDTLYSARVVCRYPKPTTRLAPLLPEAVLSAEPESVLGTQMSAAVDASDDSPKAQSPSNPNGLLDACAKNVLKTHHTTMEKSTTLAGLMSAIGANAYEPGAPLGRKDSGIFCDIDSNIRCENLGREKPTDEFKPCNCPRCLNIDCSVYVTGINPNRTLTLHMLSQISCYFSQWGPVTDIFVDKKDAVYVQFMKERSAIDAVIKGKKTNLSWLGDGVRIEHPRFRQDRGLTIAQEPTKSTNEWDKPPDSVGQSPRVLDLSDHPTSTEDASCQLIGQPVSEQRPLPEDEAKVSPMPLGDDSGNRDTDTDVGGSAAQDAGIAASKGVDTAASKDVGEAGSKNAGAKDSANALPSCSSSSLASRDREVSHGTCNGNSSSRTGLEENAEKKLTSTFKFVPKKPARAWIPGLGLVNMNKESEAEKSQPRQASFAPHCSAFIQPPGFNTGVFQPAYDQTGYPVHYAPFYDHPEVIHEYTNAWPVTEERYDSQAVRDYASFVPGYEYSTNRHPGFYTPQQQSVGTRYTHMSDSVPRAIEAVIDPREYSTNHPVVGQQAPEHLSKKKYGPRQKTKSKRGKK